MENVDSVKDRWQAAAFRGGSAFDRTPPGAYGLFAALERVRDSDELAGSLAALSAAVTDLRSTARIDVREHQEFSRCFDRIRMIMKDLEQREVLLLGASRNIADR